MKTRIVVALISALAASAAMADKLYLKSGSMLTGKAGAASTGELVFVSDDLGEVKVKLENIERLEDAGSHVVRYNDVAAALREADGPEGPALVLSRTLASGTYETRIYHYQGQVLQEFAAAGRPFDPKGATPLMQTEEFSFEVHDGLLTFTTDRGSFDVALRADAGDGSEAAPVPTDATAAPNVVTIVDEGGM